MSAAIELTIDDKVAVLLASLKKETAAAILQQLDAPTMSRVAGAIRGLGAVSGESREQVISECARGIMEMGNTAIGGEQTVNSLLTQAIGEKRAAALLQDKAPTPQAAFANLAQMTADQIAAAISQERPAVIATVLTHLSPEKSAEILGTVPSDTRKKTIAFMCTANPPSPEVIARIEEYIEAKAGGGKKQRQIDDTDKLETVTNILQQVDRSVEEELLSAIDEISESVGNSIRDRLFTFDDIVGLSDVAMRRILQEVDMAILGVALRGVSIDLRQKFFGNMSKRAAEGLKEEMEFSPKVKLSEVQAKQKEIVNVIRELDAEGQITLGEREADELV